MWGRKCKVNETLNPRDQRNGLARLPRRPRVTPVVQLARWGYGHISPVASSVDDCSTSVLLQEQVGHQLGEREKAWLHPQPVIPQQELPMSKFPNSLSTTHFSSSFVGCKQNRKFKSSVSIQGNYRYRKPWLSTGDDFLNFSIIKIVKWSVFLWHNHSAMWWNLCPPCGRINGLTGVAQVPQLGELRVSPIYLGIWTSFMSQISLNSTVLWLNCLPEVTVSKL